MKRTKTQNGITLIALIITIVVLMILAVVTINSVKDGGIITHAQDAASSYKEAQIEEEVGLYSTEYYMSNGRSMKKETIDTMVEVCTANGVLPEQLTVYYDLYNSNQNKANENTELQEEYVLYRIDKTTEEERTILEQNGVKALRGDIDLDGVLTQNDVKLIEEYDNWFEIREEATDIQVEIADIDGDGEVTLDDSSYVDCYIRGYDSYSGGYAY